MPLEITTRIGCAEQCPYCPQSKLISAYSGKTMMTMDDFVFFMGRIPKKQVVHFSGFCEPFQSPYARDMIKFSLETGRGTRIFSILTTSDQDDIKVLKYMPPYSVFVHVKGSVPNYFDNPQTAIFVGTNLAEIPMGWRYIVQPVISRAGNNGCSDNPRGHEAHRCSDNRHEQNVLLPNGDVVICCMDYGLEHVIGNLYKNTLEEIWQGRSYVSFMSKLHEGKNSLCNKCFRGIA